MTQSLAFWDILPRSLCAYRGPAANSAAALITVPIVSEIQRIVHPPCDVVIGWCTDANKPKASLASRRKPVPREKSPAACHGISQSRAVYVARQWQKPAKKREPSLKQLAL